MCVHQCTKRLDPSLVSYHFLTVSDCFPLTVYSEMDSISIKGIKICVTYCYSTSANQSFWLCISLSLLFFSVSYSVLMELLCVFCKLEIWEPYFLHCTLFCCTRRHLPISLSSERKRASGAKLSSSLSCISIVCSLRQSMVVLFDRKNPACTPGFTTSHLQDKSRLASWHHHLFYCRYILKLQNFYNQQFV